MTIVRKQGIILVVTVLMTSALVGCGHRADTVAAGKMAAPGQLPPGFHPPTAPPSQTPPPIAPAH